MGNRKLEKQQKKLMDAGIMESSDSLVDFLQVSYVERLIGKIGEWRKGWAYFTEQKLIVTTGFTGYFIIPYPAIRELSKCSQGFFPMGIAITHEETENGELVTDRISLTKRSKWLDFLAQKAGITF